MWCVKIGTKLPVPPTKKSISAQNAPAPPQNAGRHKPRPVLNLVIFTVFRAVLSIFF
jgi:hypothetical protein